MGRTASTLALVLALPALGQERPLVVRGATVHPISGPAIEGGVLLVEGGRVAAVGTASDVRLPADADVVEAAGLDLWPSLIDARSSIGLADIGSVRGTVDVTESGAMNPNARAEVAVNASSTHIAVTRANAVLLAAVVPSGALVSGTAAAMALDGWTSEEMVRRAPVGLVIEWPDMTPPKPREDEEEERDETTWQELVERLDGMIVQARAYAAAGRAGGPAPPKDVRWEALVPVVEGKVPVWIEAATITQIQAALDWTRRHGLSMVLLDGGDGWRAAAELKERKIPVVTQTTRLPLRRHDPYDTPFAAPGRMAALGVTVAFGSWSSANARNLPSEAARAVAFGMDRGAAERALTLGAAEVCGIAERYGSLEPGKSATFILAEGDLLDGRMQVKRAFLDGRELDLESHHTELWKRWSQRP